MFDQAAADQIASLDGLVDALAWHERARAAIAQSVGHLEASGQWALDGSLTMASWLQQHARLSHRDALTWVREGRFLCSYQAVAQAAVVGDLSASQIAVLRAMVDRPMADLFGEHQHGVVEAIVGMDQQATELVCADWRQRAEAVVDMPAPKVPDRSWSMSTLEDGTVVGRFVFDPAAAADLDTALETARTFDGVGDERTARVRNADAIVDILGFFNSNHAGKGTPRHRPHVELHLHTRYPGDRDSDGDRDPFGPDAHTTRDPLLDGCAITADGRLLPQWATDAHLCDCVIHRIMRAGSSVLDYGRATYTVPKPLWRAVAARDGGCRAPGCTRPVAWCDAHHIIWWRKHGHTTLDNLLMLCGRHHRLVHREKWHIRLLPNGDVEFVLPDNRLITTQPRGQPQQLLVA